MTQVPEKIGFGCVYKTHWTFGRWEEGFIQKEKPSIEFLELFALCVGFFTWGRDHLMNKRILVKCDNEVVVNMINNTSSSCPKCLMLIRKLTLKSLQLNTRIFADHLAGSKNILPDRLSRMKIDEFKFLTRNENFDALPTCPSTELWLL